MIGQWKNTAFGSDFGGDFLNLIEASFENTFCVQDIYKITDLEKYIQEPEILQSRTDNNIYFTNSKFEQYVHFEDCIIGLSAIVVESAVNGKVDLSQAYGNKVLRLDFEISDIRPIFTALRNIFEKPDDYSLFEMLSEKEREKTLKDINSILIEFAKLV